MRKTTLTVALTFGFLIIPLLTHAEVYKWIDEKGTIHFTDDESNIPSSYQERLKVEIRKDIREEKPSLNSQKIIPGVLEEESKTVFSGEEEAWGEEKIRSWMVQLEEATANFESAQREFVERAEELSRRRYGSPTMYKFDILKLNLLNQERMKYKAQMEEAEKMVRKLSKADFWEAVSAIKEGKGTDIYGIGEDWWREKVRPLRKKLEELNVSYENAEKKFMEMTEDLSKRGYGNRHTIKAKIIKLDRANKEALKYQDEIAKNDEELERISRDAEESMADPDWLK
jgi:hypothetical protein